MAPLRRFRPVARPLTRLTTPVSFVQRAAIQTRLASSDSKASDTDSSHPNPQRDAQHDREKMDTQANEYSKSGTDANAAAQEKAAFGGPSDPQAAKKEAGKGNEVNPLDASPANPELSQGTSEMESGAGEKKSGQN